MEESAPKRRRTSPRTSVAIRPEDEGAGGASTPATAPAQEPRSHRPSFASPTKSSLSRSNPDILKRRRSSQRPRGQASPERTAARGGDDNNPPDAPDSQASSGAANAPGSAATEDADSRPHLSRPPKRLSGRDLLAERARAIREAREEAGSSTSRPSHDTNPSSVDTPSRGPARLFGGFGALPRRSPAKPVPRPLPQFHGPDEEINPFAGRVLNRTPPGGHRADPEQEAQATAAPAQVEPESELPPTPTQQGKDDPIVTSPAAGIHDTPSKLRKSGQVMKSSPLKAPPLRPPDFERAAIDPSKTKGKGKAPARVSDKDLVIAIDDGDDEADDEVDDPPSGPHPARKITAFDSQPDKATLLAKLQAEARQLEADLTLATKENERIRAAQDRRPRGKHPHEPAPNPEAILDLLRRHLVPADQSSAPDVAAQLFNAALDPTSWFSVGALALPLTQAKEDEPQPISHHPVPMSADEQLPFLQAFTPFALSSTSVILPRDEPDGALMRQHNISVSSASPPGLFAARIEMTVNTDTLRVDSLRVPRLDPAAIAELGPFVEAQCEGKRNVSVVCWAMAEWYRIAVERARFWCELERQVQTPGELAAMVREVRRSKWHKKRRRDGEDADGDAGAAGGLPAKPVARGAVLAHMGRTAFEVPVPEEGVEESKWPCLRIQWKIEFDWTGEGGSKVGVLAGMPGKCEYTCQPSSPDVPC